MSAAALAQDQAGVFPQKQGRLRHGCSPGNGPFRSAHSVPRACAPDQAQAWRAMMPARCRGCAEGSGPRTRPDGLTQGMMGSDAAARTLVRTAPLAIGRGLGSVGRRRAAGDQRVHGRALGARQARVTAEGAPRIRERTLHLWELLGGWPGALLAQRWLRHQTVKPGDQRTWRRIVALHLLLCCARAGWWATR